MIIQAGPFHRGRVETALEVVNNARQNRHNHRLVDGGQKDAGAKHGQHNVLAAALFDKNSFGAKAVWPDRDPGWP